MCVSSQHLIVFSSLHYTFVLYTCACTCVYIPTVHCVSGVTAGGIGSFIGTPAEISLIRMTSDGRSVYIHVCECVYMYMYMCKCMCMYLYMCTHFCIVCVDCLWQSAEDIQVCSTLCSELVKKRECSLCGG